MMRARMDAPDVPAPVSRKLLPMSADVNAAVALVMFRVPEMIAAPVTERSGALNFPESRALSTASAISR